MTISNELSRFALATRYEDLPAAVSHRAKLFMLDALGIALASSTYEFARKAFDGLSRFGGGESIVVGFDRALPLRDAAMMNGILVHGLDYDDTYLPGAVHMSATGVPTTLGVAAHTGASGREWLTALTLGLEVAARVGRAGNGGFQKAGFHPTSVCGIMGASLAAGRLMGLDEIALTRTQGIALSMASGSMQPILDGTWTKRMHPGWASVGAITAATLASAGYIGPDEAYEGRYGFYRIFLGELASKADPASVTQALGEHWEFVRSSVKLYPACHQTHAFMNAAIALADAHDIRPADVERIDTLVADITRDMVCEPVEAKSRPNSSYAAQFSLQYSMAASLTRRRFGLQELEDSAYTDPELVALAQKVQYRIDPNAGFPKTRTGEVIVTLRDGRTLRRREVIDPDEPATEDEIVRKFMANAVVAIDAARAERICERVLKLEAEKEASELARALANP